jgi:hypothetical protein
MTQEIATKKPPYLLMYIVTLVYLVVTAFFEEGVAYFDPVYTTLMSSTEFYLTFSLCVVLFLTVIYIAKHYFEIRINWIFLVLATLLFAIDAVGILSFKELSINSGVYHLTETIRLRFLIFWLACCMSFYVFFAIMPKSVDSLQKWNFYYLGGVIIAFSACVFSYIYEAKIYAVLFDPSKMLKAFVGPVSFTNNRNTYGTLLLIGVFCSFYLFSKTRRKYWYLIGVFFLINNIFTLSKGSVLCSVCFFILFNVIDFINNRKTLFPLRLLFLVFILAVFLFPFLIKPLGLDKYGGYLAKIDSYIYSTFNGENGLSIESFSSRAGVWSDICSFIFENKISAIFGIGDWNFSWYFGFVRSDGYPYIESAHSGFFDVLGRLGLLGCLLYVGLLVYFVVLYFVGLDKRKRSDLLVCLLIWAFSLLHGAFEDTNFLNMQTKDMMLLFMAYMPVLTYKNLHSNFKKEYEWENEYALCGYSCFSRTQIAVNWSRLFSILFVPFIGIVVGLSGYYSTWHGNLLFGNTFFQLQMIQLSLFLPIILFLLSQGNRRHNVRQRIIAFFLGGLWTISCIVLSLFIPNEVTFFAVFLTGILLVLICYLLVGKPSFKRFCLPYFSFLFIESVLVSINKCVVFYLLIPDGIYQPYAAMCLIINSFLFPFLIIISAPFRDAVLGSFGDRWRRIEDSYRFICYRYQVKYEIRLMKATEKKPVLRNQK